MWILRLLLLVVIGGLIGWITNKVAIKMLFRPIEPKRILFFRFQGVFPKRKDAIAKSLAETIESELLNVDQIIDKMISKDQINAMKEDVRVMFITKIKEVVPPMFLAMLGDNIDKMINDFIDQDGDKIISELMDKIKENGSKNVDIYEIVKERLDALDFIEFERIIFGLMKKELKHIEIIGLFLGFMIGAIQYIVTTIL